MPQVYSVINGNGPPTKNTPGAVGQTYVDTIAGVTYECTEAFSRKGYKFAEAVYTWKRKGVDLDSVATDQELEAAVDKLRSEISGGISGGSGVTIFAEILN